MTDTEDEDPEDIDVGDRINEIVALLASSPRLQPSEITAAAMLYTAGLIARDVEIPARAALDLVMRAYRNKDASVISDASDKN